MKKILALLGLLLLAAPERAQAQAVEVGTLLTTISTNYADNTTNSITPTTEAAVASALAQSFFPLSGSINATLGGNVDNWAPTAYTLNTSNINVDGGIADRTITGLTLGPIGHAVRIVNSGTTNNIILLDDTTSTAANRFRLGADLTIPPKGTCTIRYDDSAGRWRPWSTCLNTSGSFTTITIAPVANTRALYVNAGSSTSGTVPSVELVGTFNTAASPAFFKVSLTDTASGASATLFDWQVDGTSVFNQNIASAGGFMPITIGGAATGKDGGLRGITGGATGNLDFEWNYTHVGVSIAAARSYQWSSTASTAASIDTNIYRNAAGEVAVSTGARDATPLGVYSAASYKAAGLAGVSCGAGTLNPVTAVVTGGIITHC